jgi:hypothetical protein
VLVEVLDPVQPSFVVCPSIGSWFDSPVEWEVTFCIPTGEVVGALNDDVRREVPPFAVDAFDNRCPFSIPRLNCLASSASIGTRDHHRCADDAHHEACLVEVVEIAILDTVLGSHVVYKLKPRVNKPWVFAESYLEVVDAIETRPRPWLLFDEGLRPVLADRFLAAFRKEQIGRIFNTSQVRCKSSEIQLHGILDNRLLFQGRQSMSWVARVAL